MDLCASQIGNLCNFSEWAAIAGISNGSVREYAEKNIGKTRVFFVRPEQVGAVSRNLRAGLPPLNSSSRTGIR